MENLYILDISAMVYRCWHAMEELTTTAGEQIHAFYGTCSMLSKFMQRYYPQWMVVACDHPGKCFRHGLYPEYKANRNERPEELQAQFDYVYKMLEALGVCRFEIDGYEADDIIATLVRRYSTKYQCFILSGDKDLTQLVNDHVFMIDFDHNVLGREQVHRKFGIYPEGIVDYLSLVGDSSDNIKGAYNIGAKIARWLISEYGSIENIYANIDKIFKPKSKRREYLIRDYDNVKLAQRLIRLEGQCSLTGDTDFSIRINQDALDRLFQKVDFRYANDRFPGLYGYRPMEFLDSSPIIV